MAKQGTDQLRRTWELARQRIAIDVGQGSQVTFQHLDLGVGDGDQGSVPLIRQLDHDGAAVPGVHPPPDPPLLLLQVDEVGAGGLAHPLAG